MSDLISVNEMSNERLYELFKAAYMKPEYDSDGDVRIKGPSSFHQIVNIDADKQLIKFIAMFGLKEDRSHHEKLEFINKLNDGVVFSRFSMPREDVLLADYFLAYEEGIMPLQILSSMKWFDKATIGAIRQYDESDLVA